MQNHVKKIGVLTSGGDAPGMNSAIRAVVRAGIKHDIEVVGIRYGYNGLMNADLVEMSIRSVSNISHRGGTVLYTARCPEFKEWEGVLRAKVACEQNGIEGIVVVGGDGSFRGAADLSKAGIPCIGVPGTIDNDISCTDYSIGFDSAMNTAMDMVDKIRDTTVSHSRCAVVEVMGRHSGYIALDVGIACGATVIVIQEAPMTPMEVVAKIKAAQALGKENFVVVVSEGVGKSHELAAIIQKETGVESRATILGHIQRGGAPTIRDRVDASAMGHYAVELLSKGIGNRVVGMKKDEVVDFDIQEALNMVKPFPMDLYHMATELSF